MNLTLRIRLAAISAIVFGLLLAGLGAVSYEVLGRRLDADVTERLTELTDGLHGYLRFGGGTVTVAFDVADNDAMAFVHEATRYFQVYDVDTGRLLNESPGLRPLALHLTRGEIAAFRAAPRPFDIRTDYGRLRVSNSVGTTPDGHPYLLQVGVPLRAMDETLARYRDLLVWRTPIGLMLAVAASWWLSKFALLPLARVAAAVRTIDVRTLERRLPVRGAGDELDEVAEAFNATLARLEAAVGDMRQFGAAMAHELRTPLAALRGEIDLAWRSRAAGPGERERFASQLEEIDRLTRLIDHILTLARAESGEIPLTRAPLDLSRLVCDLVDQFEPIASAKSIALRADAPARIVVQGDAGWLQRLVLNLVDNAVKFTGEHGGVTVRVSRDDDVARLDVEDTGVGLSTEDAQRVFERFFRADVARSTQGAGLGLSLVRWIASQHQGTVSVRSESGHGSTFTVRLPVARQPI